MQTEYSWFDWQIGEFQRRCGRRPPDEQRPAERDEQAAEIGDGALRHCGGDSAVNMFPVVLSFLLLAVLNQESTAENSTGTDFLVVFPENIAYYYPVPASNKVFITGFHDFTTVEIESHAGVEGFPESGSVNSGEVMEFSFPQRSELNKSSVNGNTYQIKSNDSIMVQALNLKNSSVQSILVIPSEKLGTEYLLPPIPAISGTSDPKDKVTESVTERAPFKVIAINGDAPNSVTVEGGNPVSLAPFQTAQIYLNPNEAQTSVTADAPVAILFGHTCATVYNCTCGMLLTPLPPTPDEKQLYYIPPQMAGDAVDESFVLLGGSTQAVSFQNKVEVKGPAFLYRPGILMNLIPEAEFGSCYAVNTISGIENKAIIVAKTHETGGVHIGDVSAAAEAWVPLEGTPYSAAYVDVYLSSFIWHENSTMGVYYLGVNGSSTFGNPAGIVSKTPDFRGCAITPERVEIGENTLGWRESHKYCKDKEMELVSMSSSQQQQQIYTRLMKDKSDNVLIVWVGMRRSSMNGEWYWLDKQPVNTTNWRPGAPGIGDGGQCVSVSLEAGQNFTWTDTECCSLWHPVCYNEPVLLTQMTPAFM